MITSMRRVPVVLLRRRPLVHIVVNVDRWPSDFLAAPLVLLRSCCMYGELPL